MKGLTKVLSIILALAITITALPLVGVNLFVSAEAKTVSEYSVGDIIEFGSYPQSEVTDTSLLSSLNSLSLNWVSYDYYSGTGDCDDGQMTSGDYMKYADVTYKGDKYRAIKFTGYRPYCTGYENADGTYQDDNGYYTNTVYWFYFEPLQWRVIDPDEGFMMCESIIDSQPYNNTTYYNGSANYQDTNCTNYANDYATSSIRDWLNDDFYNTAFTNTEKEKILNLPQDNSCWNPNFPQYDSDTTYDKIFLLSYDEVKNSKYGFSESEYNHDIARQVQGTDYAKAQGLYVHSSSGSAYHGNSFWWLRTPDYSSIYACAVAHDGFSDGDGKGYVTYYGVRPALKRSSNEDLPDDDDIIGDKNGTCGDNLTWSFNEITNTLTISGTGTMYGDSSIQPWDDYKNSIEKVVIDEGVTTICDYAFDGCTNLINVTIPNSLTSIGHWVFSNCEKLMYIKIPEGVSSIGAFAFFGCIGLINITIPNSVTTIGSRAFAYCTSLTNVTVESENEYYSSDENGVLFNKAKTEIVQYPAGNINNTYIIPNSVTTIGNFAFYYCTNLTSIKIVESVTTIGEAAFFACTSLKNITIPNSIVSISDNAFQHCEELKSIAIPNSVTSIGFYAFDYCDNLEDAYYIGSEKQWNQISVEIGNDPLLNATIHFNSTGGDITDDDEMTCDKTGTCGNNLTWSLDSNGVLTISGTGDMYNWPDSLSAPWVDYRNSISSIVIEKGVTSIGDYAFDYCMNCTNVFVSGTVTSIGDYAFDLCDSITGLTIPVSVTSIGDYAFFHCIEIEDVYYLGSEKQWNNISIGIGNIFTTATIHFADEIDGTCYIADRKFDDNIDHYTTYWDSSEYNAKLANMLAALSYAVYDEIDIRNAYFSLGFIDYELYDYYIGYNSNTCGYSIAFKESDYNNDIICLVSVRGSQSLAHNADWVGNLKIATNSDEEHVGFANPANNIYDKIQNYLNSNNISGDVKYVITGHSRGGAVANLLAVKLMRNGISSRDIFNYNFACPDVACKREFPEYDNIFNLCNREDPVPFLPGTLASVFTGFMTSWDKYGRTYWFTVDADDTLSPFADHSMKLYLEFFDQQTEPSDWGESFADRIDDNADLITGWLAKILCPVDVIISDKLGNKIASVINGEINYYDSNFGDVIILTDGDRKVIYIDGERDFNVELIGTDTGMMTYSLEKCNLAGGEIFESKTFEDVVLEKGKTMYSPVSEAEQTKDIQLFVTEEKNGELVYTHIVNENGVEETYYAFSIQDPSRTEIRHKDGIKLHTNIEGTAPTGSYVVWTASNNKFKTEEINNGNSLKIVSDKNGTTTFTATLYSADGEVLATDSIEMRSKAGFFDKFGSFFRSLFGTTKIYEN